MEGCDGLIHFDKKLITLTDFYDNIECNDENKINYIESRNELTKVTHIQRYKPDNKVLCVSTKTGNFLICQSNHILFIKKNNIHEKYSNKYCRLIGNNEYIEYMSTRKPFKINDENIKEIYSNELKIYDTIWIDNSISVFNNKNIKPELSGYMCGIYCAEGSKIWSNRKTKGNFISQKNEGVIKEKIIQECNINYERTTVTKKGIWLWDNNQNINKIILGNYSWTKRLNIDFIDYDKNWLSDFLAGWIDGDGTVFTNSSTCCRIYTTSYYLAQQLKMICLKLGYKCNVCTIPPNKGFKRSRIQFICDLRFPVKPYIDSEKLKISGNIKLSVTRPFDKIICGFDTITKIKEIEWPYCIYDIKTEKGEYMLNCIQNHN